MVEGYLNFDEYIRQGEPSQREKAGYWQTAIGLQAVDGLKVSSYLHIHPTAEWSVQPNLNTPQVPDKYPDKFNSHQQSKRH